MDNSIWNFRESIIKVNYLDFMTDNKWILNIKLIKN